MMLHCKLTYKGQHTDAQWPNYFDLPKMAWYKCSLFLCKTMVDTLLCTIINSLFNFTA